MTTITFTPATFANIAAEKLRGLVHGLSEAVDAFAAYRMQHAVPEQELRRAEREIGHYRRAMQAQRLQRRELMEPQMSILTHTQDVLPAFHDMRTVKTISQPIATAPSSHVAMIKRFAKFAGALLMMVLVVAAVGGIKLAIYWPHFAH